MKHGKTVSAALWTLQVLLAALFLFAGTFKLTMPAEALAQQTGLPALFMQFISVAEVAGGLGLLLPGLLRIHRRLTPVAACGLVLVMIGAAVMPFVVGALLVVVVRGRREWAIIR